VNELAGSLGSRIADLIAVGVPAAAPIPILTVCAVVFAMGWGYRGSVTRWWATVVQVAALLAALVVLALQISDHGWLVEVDGTVTKWLVGHRFPAADQVALAVTDVFGPAETAGAAILLGVVTALKFRSNLSGLVVIMTVGGVSALCAALKLLMARARPPIGIQETLETDYSFPSGHVTGTGALLGMFVVVVGMNQSATLKRWLMTAAMAFVAAVAASRLYLEVHWLTDVIAGALLGAAAVGIGATTLRGLLDDDVDEAAEGVDTTPRREVML